MRSLSRLLVAAALVAAAGCDQMPDPPGGSPPSGARSTSAAASSAPADGAARAGDVEAAAKVYLEAARKYAETCHCSSDPFEGLIRDLCDVKGAAFDAVIAARAGVDAHLKAQTPLDPPLGAFLREAQLHATWLVDYRAYLESTPIKIADDSKLIRGGIYAYQRLAILWNEWRPKEPISGIAYGSYWPGGVRTSEYPLWIATSQDRWGAPSREKPRYLPWIECIDGPCLVGY